MPEVGPLLAENVFYLKPGGQNEKFTKFYLYLYDSKIFLSKSKERKPFGFMDVENIFIR